MQSEVSQSISQQIANVDVGVGGNVGPYGLELSVARESQIVVQTFTQYATSGPKACAAAYALQTCADAYAQSLDVEGAQAVRDSICEPQSTPEEDAA